MKQKSLSETSIFNYTEKLSSSVKINTLLNNILDEKMGARFLTETDLEDVLYKLRHKSFNFAAKFAIVDLFRKGIIKLVYNDKVKMTVAIPFFKFKMADGGYGVVINVTNYARIDRNGNFNIDTLTLYCLMLTAAFDLTNGLDSLKYDGLIELYSDLFASIVGRLINLDKPTRDKYKFVMSKYMYIQFGLDEMRATSAAEKDIKNLTKQSIDQIDLLFPVAVYENLEILINHMRKVFPEFEKVTFGMVFEKWMRSYGECSSFAIEYIPYFLLVFNALIINCNNLVNVKMIEKEANKNNRKMITLFNKIENYVMELAQR